MSKSHTFTVVAANGDSAVLSMGSSDAYWVDLFIPFLASGQTASEFDGGDFTFKYTVDGTNYKAVPGMTVADNENGYKGRFLVWGSKLKFTLANSSGSTTTVPVVTYKAASMTQSKGDWTVLAAGVLNADAGTEAFTFGRAPTMLLLDTESSTQDNVTMTIQATPDGTSWVDLPGQRADANDEYRVYSNPAGLTRFRIEWTTGGLSAAGFTINVIGLTNQDEMGIKKDADVWPSPATGVVVTVGTADTSVPKTLADQTATHSQTVLNNSFATLGEDHTLLAAEMVRVVDALRANGILPTVTA